ncbi:MAG TPA: RICIN domain-containing protein [Mucilaginibacter sp.]|jgi:hypothetical protein|nr:RICIN domain-containing protein [Mucilaginibacter sp.]
MSLKTLLQNRRVLALLIISTCFTLQLHAQDVVDATNFNNKILAGYQGWFRTAGDVPGSTSWAHVFNRRGDDTSKFVAQRLALDTWPDMKEYDKDEGTVIPGWTFPDGSPATMYSAQNPKTVLRHFQWMKQYGIDGVWLSEFCGEFKSPALLKVLDNVRAAAKATGRTYAFMWDMSSYGRNATKEQVYNGIINQWKKMVDEGVTSDDRYMHQDGKPVLLLWGFFPERPASQPDYMTPVLDFLLAPGKYQAVMVAGTTNTWRKGTPEFINMIARMQALQPWSVGRQKTDFNTGYKVPYMDEWGEDMDFCKKHNMSFQPVINSGTHIAGPPPAPGKLTSVPRRMGNYLWAQFQKASQTGVISSAFIAMFDEVNEGTQINKISNHPPVNAPFLTYNGATNDFYLRLIGTASRMLKDSIPFTSTIPISPFSSAKVYILKNQATGKVLHTTGKLATSKIVQAQGKGAEWQLLFDGNGYFIIKNKVSGKVLGAGAENKPVAQVTNSGMDNVKWHLEWLPNGNCRIVNKATSKTISGLNAMVTQVTAPIKVNDLKKRDDLNWQVIEN